MSQYLVYIAEAIEDMPPRIVNADNEEDALTKYTRHVLIRDEIFLDHAYGRAVNASFAEYFFRDEGGYFLDDRTGDLRVHHEYAEAAFEANIREFFGVRQDFADLYLAFYNSDDADSPEVAAAKWHFPEERLLANDGRFTKLLWGHYCTSIHRDRDR